MSDHSQGTRYSSLSLKEIVSLCAESRDEDAWGEFLSRTATPVKQVITRTASHWGTVTRWLVEDLSQITYLKLWEGGCQLLQEFAIERPEAILGYVRRIAVNSTHDYFKHDRSQSSGGNEVHVSTNDVDPESGTDLLGTEERMARELFLQEIDEYLKSSLSGPDAERDRMIFWLYFRQGMSTKEIASLPTIELCAKGVGSVLERLKQCIRERILQDPRPAKNIKAKSAENSY